MQFLTGSTTVLNLSDRASAQLQSPTARRLQTAAPGRVSLHLRLDLAADLTFGTKEVLLWFPFTPALTLRSVFWFCQFGFCLVFFLLILLDSVFGSFKLHPLESRAPNRSRINDACGPVAVRFTLKDMISEIRMYGIDLDLPPDKRWADVVAAYLPFFQPVEKQLDNLVKEKVQVSHASIVSR